MLLPKPPQFYERHAEIDRRAVERRADFQRRFVEENERNLVRTIFEPALHRAGLPRMRFHDLPHSFASLLIVQGALDTQVPPNQADRLETLSRCDEVAILEAGRVVEYGERAALAADGSTRFAQLLRAGLDQVLA